MASQNAAIPSSAGEYAHGPDLRPRCRAAIGISIVAGWPASVRAAAIAGGTRPTTRALVNHDDEIGADEIGDEEFGADEIGDVETAGVAAGPEIGPMSMSDQAHPVGSIDLPLVGSHANADEVAFVHFCELNYPSIMRSLVLALNSVDLGKDAADEAFARAWQRWGSVSQMSSPGGWTYRVGLNWGLSLLRRRRREVKVAFSDLDDRVVLDHPIDPALVRAVAGLSVDHRAVVVAKFYLDWTEADIAAALKIAPGTVKSRLSRALEKLESALGKAEK